MSRGIRTPLGDVLRDIAADINADPSPEGLARTERECMEALFPGSTRPPLPPVAPGASALEDVRKALDTRWSLLVRCRSLIGALRGVECGGRMASGHYTLGGYGLGEVAALLVAIDLEGETADPLTGEGPVLPSELPSMPIGSIPRDDYEPTEEAERPGGGE